MGVIINDLSLTGQFKDTDDFLDSLYECTIPMLDRLEELKIQILSSYNSYGLNVTNNKTLHDMLSIKGIPEISKFKRQLQELFFDEPYWDSNPLSVSNVYQCKFTTLSNNFCLAEALERNMPVISFEHEQFKESVLGIKRNNKEYSLYNIFSNQFLLEILRKQNEISQIQYLLLKHSLTESFGLKKGENYFNDLVENNSLSNDDVGVIVDDIEKLIIFTEQGENPGRLSKTIEGKLKEFRTSLTSNRQIRIFYFEVSKKIIFINGFLKKTQETPQGEIDKAKQIIQEY